MCVCVCVKHAKRDMPDMAGYSSGCRAMTENPQRLFFYAVPGTQAKLLERLVLPTRHVKAYELGDCLWCFPRSLFCCCNVVMYIVDGKMKTSNGGVKMDLEARLN